MKQIIIILCLYTGMTSCLGLQPDFDYTPVPANNHVNMSVWEFINERADLFGDMKELIEWADMESCYTQTENEYTYILLTNTAVESTSATTPGVLKSLGVTTVAQITGEKLQQLKDILRYHIIRGSYHGLGTLSYDPTYVITLKGGQDVVMTISMNNDINTSTYSSVQFNWKEGVTSSSAKLIAETSNIFATNGVVHVMAKQVTPL